MTSLKITGETLGERHKTYNQAVEDIIKKNTSFDVLKNEPNITDYDHLMKIDIASQQRNVKYILDVLRSNDMLHVSRALKKSVWLITDPQYANIINPEYLHNELLPTMTSKAGSKLMLHVRLNLKDGTRVEEFYKYYEERDIKKAVKWLQHCSVPVIEDAVKKHLDEIDDTLFRRLCQKSFSIFEACAEKIDSNKLKSTVFLLKNNLDRFLEVMEKRNFHQWSRPKFGVRHTDVIMKLKKQFILDNFDKIYYNINMKTFVKHLTVEEVKEFLIKQSANENLSSWYNQNNLAPFIDKLPSEGKFEFVKDLFINKTVKAPPTNIKSKGIVEYQLCCAAAPRKFQLKPKSKPYLWYKYAKFEEAFPELKKMIQTESSPEERANILKVLITSAGKNEKNVKTVLEYLRGKHMNEPFIHKIQFVNHFMNVNHAFKFDDETWSILDTLFQSLDVYTDPKNNVQTCLENIILRNVILNKTIPEMVERKFVFNTFVNYRKKLNKEEQEKIITYLMNNLANKLKEEKVNIDVETESYIQNMIKLFTDWKKHITDYNQSLLKTIKQYILKHNKSIYSILLLFKDQKSWRKDLYEESLIISPSSETFLNSLKHDPSLLSRHQELVDKYIFEENNIIKEVLRKIKIYWPESLRQEWIKKYQKQLEPSNGDIASDKTYKVIVNGLFMLLPAEDSLNLIIENAPKENKIVWEEVDRSKLALQKAIGTCMHVTRPQLTPDAAIMYAKGDYFQFVLPSLVALLHYTSKKASREYIISLLYKPVSVQKHALRFAFAKMNLQELQEIFENVWSNSKNSTIRNVIFELTLKLMCKEKNNDKVEELWKLLEMFISKLTDSENKNIYQLLTKVSNVPDSIKGRYFVVGYKFLKSLPAKADCESLVEEMENKLSDVVDKVDEAFFEQYILDYIEEKFVKKNKTDFDISNLVVNYVLKTPDAEKQIYYFNKVMVPLLKHIFPPTSESYKFESKNILTSLLQEFGEKFSTKQKFIQPVNLLYVLQKMLDENLPKEDYYTFGYEWKILTSFIESMNEESIASIENLSDSDWKNHVMKMIPSFGKKITNLLTTEYQKHHDKIGSIHIIFASALNEVLSYYFRTGFDTILNFKVCKEIMDLSSEPYVYLAVIHVLDEHVYLDDKELIKERNNLLIRIYNHPDIEVKVCFVQKFKKIPENSEEEVTE